MGLYRCIWRWHFYAGLFCIPFIIALAVSGSLYLFKPQIDSWNEQPYHDQVFQGLEENAVRAAPAEQIAAALKAVPGARFADYRLPKTDSQAVLIGVNRSGKRILVYIDPYNLQVLKTQAAEAQLVNIVRSFHGELLAGNLGSVLVELAGCWTIVLLITGLYLWWPRSARGLAGVVYPRLRRGSRMFWRDLHAVTGIWIAGFTLFLLITGLPWALVWGTAFKELRQLNAPPQTQDWTLSRAEEQSIREAAGMQSAALSPALLASAESLQFASPAVLAPSRQTPGAWTLDSKHQNRPLRAHALLSGATGEILEVKTFADRKAIDRVIGIGIAAHEGQLFGWFNQLLGLVTTLGLIAMSISGFVLWRKRKPVGLLLGAPPALPNPVIGKTVAAIVLLMAALLPLLAISLILILLLEKLVFRQLASSPA